MRSCPRYHFFIPYFLIPAPCLHRCAPIGSTAAEDARTVLIKLTQEWPVKFCPGGAPRPFGHRLNSPRLNSHRTELAQD
eukprot:2356234-Pyramimonas_sp.AAC.1